MQNFKLNRQIAHLVGSLESKVFELRQKYDIQRVYKLVDTCAAEFQAQTPYYYSTFERKITFSDGQDYAENESVSSKNKKIIV